MVTVAELILTNSDLNCTIDDQFHIQLNKVKWRVDRGGYPVCDRKTKVYQLFNTRRLHRIIYQLLNGKINRQTQIDHIDRNPLNNHSSNLRPATNQQNSMNKANNKKSKVNYKGVSFNEYSRKFIAKVTHNGKGIHLGSFDDAREAALAYNSKVIELFGEWAYFNDMEEGGLMINTDEELGELE